MRDSRESNDLRPAVQRYYAALDADDLEAVLGCFSGEVLYRRPGYETIVGLERLRAYYAGERRLAAGRHLVREFVTEGHKVAVHGAYEGALRDGTRTAVGFAAFFTFDQHGRIAEHTTYFFTPAV